jgi:hypothetical protein
MSNMVLKALLLDSVMCFCTRADLRPRCVFQEMPLAPGFERVLYQLFNVMFAYGSFAHPVARKSRQVAPKPKVQKPEFN